MFIQDGRDVELLETQPRIFVGDWRKFEITVEHFDRGEGATIGLTFLVFDESGTQVQSNGMTEISVGSLECNNSWRQLRVRISARKANAIMMRHLDGFESLDLVLNDGQYQPARISYLTEIIGLDLDFDDREHDRFEALISRMFQSFEKLSDENKDWVLRDYYDLLEGASVYDTEEVVQRLNEGRNLGGDVASDLIRTFVCLPEDLQNILVDGDTDDKVTYVMENISSDQNKC